MSFLLDTDIISAHLRGRREVTRRMFQHIGQLAISAVSLAELKSWLNRKNTPQRYRDAFSTLMPEMIVLPVEEIVAERFGEIGAHLLDAGQSAATPDLLIAATALVHNRTVVTGNTRHFAAIDVLRVENWLQ